MSEALTNWSRKEFKLYLLLYCSHANLEEKDEEIELIKSKVDTDTYGKIHKELEKDNDYQSIQKIMYNLDKFNYTVEEKHKLLEDIKDVFYSDGEFDLMEQNLLLSLKHFF